MFLVFAAEKGQSNVRVMSKSLLIVFGHCIVEERNQAPLSKCKTLYVFLTNVIIAYLGIQMFASLFF